MARIQDVAAAANVSKATVSYVFSPEKSALISPETRERVLKAARKLGYRPSFLGKSLSACRTFNVGLIMPSRCGRSMSKNILDIFHGLLCSSEASDYNLNIFLASDKRIFSSLDSRRFDGVIVIGLGSNKSLLERIAAYQLPMVVLNRNYPASGNVGCVYNDFPTWLTGELQYMYEHDCRRVMVFNKSLAHASGKELDDALKQLPDGLRAIVSVREVDHYSPTQFAEVLQLPEKCDGFIFNGDYSGRLFAAAQEHNADLEGCIVSSIVYSDSSDSKGRLWYRNGHTLAMQGWQLLQSMMDKSSAGKSIALPLIRTSEAAKKEKSSTNYGFDV